jgi:hypothetical protein
MFIIIYAYIEVPITRPVAKIIHLSLDFLQYVTKNNNDKVSFDLEITILYNIPIRSDRGATQISNSAHGRMKGKAAETFFSFK